MRAKRARMIYKLVRDKDPNVIETIKDHVGKAHFEKMGGVAIYRMAKKLWTMGKGKESWICSK